MSDGLDGTGVLSLGAKTQSSTSLAISLQATVPVTATGSLRPLPELPQHLGLPTEYDGQIDRGGPFPIEALRDIDCLIVVAKKRLLPASHEYLKSRIARYLAVMKSHLKSPDDIAVHCSDLAELLMEWPADIAEKAIQWGRRQAWMPDYAELYEHVKHDIKLRKAQLKYLESAKKESIRPALPTPEYVAPELVTNLAATLSGGSVDRATDKPPVFANTRQFWSLPLAERKAIEKEHNRKWDEWHKNRGKV